ncbi:hypothetical protein BC829DRAFT_420745 [Chytridium lagenaria]|nr:hypothetical protein BC829DRAFT_420745 [Chytridium lagenaria]
MEVIEDVQEVDPLVDARKAFNRTQLLKRVEARRRLVELPKIPFTSAKDNKKTITYMMKSLHVGEKFFVDEYNNSVNGRNTGVDALARKVLWWTRCQAIIRYINTYGTENPEPALRKLFVRFEGDCEKNMVELPVYVNMTDLPTITRSLETLDIVDLHKLEDLLMVGFKSILGERFDHKPDCVKFLASALMRFKKKNNKYRIGIQPKVGANERMKQAVAASKEIQIEKGDRQSSSMSGIQDDIHDAEGGEVRDLSVGFDVSKPQTAVDEEEAADQGRSQKDSSPPPDQPVIPTPTDDVTATTTLDLVGPPFHSFPGDKEARLSSPILDTITLVSANKSGNGSGNGSGSVRVPSPICEEESSNVSEISEKNSVERVSKEGMPINAASVATKVRVLFQVYGYKGTMFASVHSEDGKHVEKINARKVAQTLLTNVGTVLLQKKPTFPLEIGEIVFVDDATGEMDYDASGAVPEDGKPLKVFIILRDMPNDDEYKENQGCDFFKNTHLLHLPTPTVNRRRNCKIKFTIQSTCRMLMCCRTIQTEEDFEEENEEVDFSDEEDDLSFNNNINSRGATQYSSENYISSDSDLASPVMKEFLRGSRKREVSKTIHDRRHASKRHREYTSSRGQAHKINVCRMIEPCKSYVKLIHLVPKLLTPTSTARVLWCWTISSKGDPKISEFYIPFKKRREEFRQQVGGCNKLTEHFKPAFNLIELPNGRLPATINHFDYIHRNLLYVKTHHDKLELKTNPFTYK